MNSSFWKTGVAKNSPLLLLPLFVPGSSRASAAPLPLMTGPRTLLSLSSCVTSAALRVPCSAAHLLALTLSSIPLKVNLFYFSNAFSFFFAWLLLMFLLSICQRGSCRWHSMSVHLRWWAQPSFSAVILDSLVFHPSLEFTQNKYTEGVGSRVYLGAIKKYQYPSDF